MSNAMTIRWNEGVANDLELVINSNKTTASTKTEVFKRGVSLFSLIISELEKGNKVCISNEDGSKILKEIVNF